MIFHVTLEQAEDGWIVAECPALPGCVSKGKDEEEAPDNIKEVGSNSVSFNPPRRAASC